MAGIKEVSDLREKSIINIGEEPCRIVKISSSMPGKHGHKKYSIEAVGVFDGRKRNISKPSDAKIEIPDVEMGNAQVISLLEESAQLMSMSTYETFEVKITEELRNELKEGDEVEYIQVAGRRKIEGKG
ncbi:hypothetical protein AKJ43_02055 [candidate division MSBL1 archaeon SCGC-AAA261D19]|uniref:Translation initiation factor 5A C-terminal domain-containing protein n=1 Tax=candidate division MSBL1 archaeon SCGC-AAA261D19 TaxID=1698273 RepID=A0A133V782_9EURY|nr:hypothetical protein AKJ43_02055 [candidate division MSBL1 archaeon SCGC-AAA261D19]